MLPPLEWLCERKLTAEGLSQLEGASEEEEAGTMQENLSLPAPLCCSSILRLFGGRGLERVAGSQVVVKVRSLFSDEASSETKKR